MYAPVWSVHGTHMREIRRVIHDWISWTDNEREGGRRPRLAMWLAPLASRSAAVLEREHFFQPERLQVKFCYPKSHYLTVWLHDHSQICSIHWSSLEKCFWNITENYPAEMCICVENACNTCSSNIFAVVGGVLMQPGFRSESSIRKKCPGNSGTFFRHHRAEFLHPHAASELSRPLLLNLGLPILPWKVVSSVNCLTLS